MAPQRKKSVWDYIYGATSGKQAPQGYLENVKSGNVAGVAHNVADTAYGLLGGKFFSNNVKRYEQEGAKAMVQPGYIANALGTGASIGLMGPSKASTIAFKGIPEYVTPLVNAGAKVTNTIRKAPVIGKPAAGIVGGTTRLASSVASPYVIGTQLLPSAYSSYKAGTSQPVQAAQPQQVTATGPIQGPGLGGRDQMATKTNKNTFVSTATGGGRRNTVSPATPSYVTGGGMNDAANAARINARTGGLEYTPTAADQAAAINYNQAAPAGIDSILKSAPAAVQQAFADYNTGIADQALKSRAADIQARDLYSQRLIQNQGNAANMLGGYSPGIYGQATTGAYRDYNIAQNAVTQGALAQQDALARLLSRQATAGYSKAAQDLIDAQKKKAARVAAINATGMGL